MIEIFGISAHLQVNVACSVVIKGELALKKKILLEGFINSR